MKDLNPVNADEKELSKQQAERVRPDLESDKFSPEEQEEIVDTVIEFAKKGIEEAAEWKEKKKKDLQHLLAEKPSVIEGLKKEGWMSDRNLGICPAVCDIYQATLLSTCFNPDTIHFKATEYNDIDNKDNLEKFTKWGLGQPEANFFPEVDDFINNRIGFGFSCFKIFWEVKYEWVDKRIPVYSKTNNKRLIRYERKTEKRRFERGVIKNIANLDDIIIPNFGQNIQDMAYFIEVLHFTINDLDDFRDRGIIVGEKDALRKKMVQALQSLQSDKLKAQDAEALGFDVSNIATIDDKTVGTMPVDIYEAYIPYTKGGKKEKYRFWVEPLTRTFLSGKPLRKINRSGKLPYSGGPLRRRPGFLRGGSLPSLIADPTNALNNNYNQTSDFQYIENMPFGFAQFAEGFTKAVYEIQPGKIYNTDGDPTKQVYFPNLSRSLAWSYDDKKFLLEIIERLTGAASYFLTSQSNTSTSATRDTIVEEKGQTKFGLWVKRIQSDICEAINQWIQLYQDWAPPKLGTRVLGEDGKRLFKNLSINSLRGMYDASMSPDLTSGSKVYEKQMKMWGFQALQQSIWFNPQINARGNWLVTKEAMQAMGYQNAEKYLPPQPKEDVGSSKDVQEEFSQMMQGDIIDPDEVEGISPMVVEHLHGHVQQMQERIHELDEEYQKNFEHHVFKTYVNYHKFLKKVQQEQLAMDIARNAIGKLDPLMAGSQPGPMQPGPVAPTQEQPTPTLKRPPIPGLVGGPAGVANNVMVNRGGA